MEAAGECQKNKNCRFFFKRKISKIPNLFFGPKLLDVADVGVKFNFKDKQLLPFRQGKRAVTAHF